MKTEHVIIVGLLLIVIVGAAFWMGTLSIQPPSNNGRDNPIPTPGRGNTVTNPPSTNPPIDTTPVEEDFPPVPPGTTYPFGVKFEPPTGRVVHGIGNYPSYNKKYTDLLGDEMKPAAELIFSNIDDEIRPWESTIKNYLSNLNEKSANGRIPVIAFNFVKGDISNEEYAALDDKQFGLDKLVAETTTYDSRIRDLAQVVKDFKKPVMMRIGIEFNGWWSGQHPYVYPKAYRKVVDIFREMNVDNAAFVWVWETAAPADFDEKDAQGNWKWYPGDEYVDWFGVDIYEPKPFTGAETASGGLTIHGKLEKFYDMAIEHERPILVEFSTPNADITPDLVDGKKDWEAEFLPFFNWVHSHPAVAWIHVISYDWTQFAHYAENVGWKNADITNNAYISQQFVDEMEADNYLHSEERYLLKDYTEYK